VQSNFGGFNLCVAKSLGFLLAGAEYVAGVATATLRAGHVAVAGVCTQTPADPEGNSS
jgi:hypothetical protein